MGRREALEAYRQAQAEKTREQSSGSMPSVRVPSAPPPSAPPDRSQKQPDRPARPRIDDPAAHALKHYEKWMAQDNAADIVEYYPFLPMPTQRMKVLNWAVETARSGNLQPLLGLGVEDNEPVVQKQLNRLLETIPASMLLAKIAEGRFTIKERRSVAGLLGRCKDPQAGRLLATLSQHEDSRVRESALQALAYFPPSDGLHLPIFLRGLEDDAHSEVQLRAAYGLVRLGTQAALAGLEKAAKKDTATPELQAVLLGWHARRRAKQNADSGMGIAAVKAERKPFPVALVGKVCALLLVIGLCGSQLAPPVQRWYAKRVAVQQAQAAAAAAAAK